MTDCAAHQCGAADDSAIQRAGGAMSMSRNNDRRREQPEERTESIPRAAWGVWRKIL